MSGEKKLESEFINRLNEILEANFENEHFGVSELAKAMGMSRSNLHRKIITASKISANQYIRQFRLQKGLEILKQTSFTVSEVSYKVGFSSPSYFIKCFHDYYGYAPGKVGTREEENEDSVPEKSILVLPFENVSPEPDQEYFCDGLTEEIITDLSCVHDLLVISRSSAMTFKGTKKKIKEIVSEVNVRYVLEGSVRKSENNLRITAQLIDSKNDTHLWAEKYNERMENIFEIQENVSRSIVNALKLRLTPKEEKSMVERPIDNVHANDCYHKAKYEIMRFSEESLERALLSLQNALDFVGENPQLYAVMGYAHFQYVNAGIKQGEHFEIAEKYANKALKLDPDSAEANLTIALISLIQGSLKKAIIHINKALANNPNDPDIIIWGSWIYFQVGKNSVMAQLIERALKVDPINAMGYMTLGAIDYLEGRYKLAVEHCLKAYKMQPDNPMVSWWYVMTLAYDGRYEDAISIVDECLKSPVQNVMNQLSHFIKLTLQRDLDGISQLLTEDFLATGRRDLQMSYHIATWYSFLGQIESAFEWLENAVNRGFINYPLMNNVDPFLENIRGEERFKRLMVKVKTEWENIEV